MSRYDVEAINPDHEVAVGWDNPMRTFFATVHDRTIPEYAADHDLILILGEKYDEIQTAEGLQS